MNNALRVQKLHAHCYFVGGCRYDRQIGASRICCPEPASSHCILQLQNDGERTHEHLMQATVILMCCTWQCLETICTDTSIDNIGGAQPVFAQGHHA